jgi:plastocyanin
MPHGAEKTSQRGVGAVTLGRFHKRSNGVAIGLAGICFILGFSLMTVLARVTHGGEQAAELVSASALDAGSNSVAHASIQGFQFDPSQVKVSPGMTVLWTNRDGVEHDVTLLQHELASPLVGKGGEIAVTFRKPGNYRYYCHVHPFMQGTVIVE